MPLLLLVSIVGLGLDYRRLAEKQGNFVRLAMISRWLNGILAGAARVWFYLRASKRSARA